MRQKIVHKFLTIDRSMFEKSPLKILSQELVQLLLKTVPKSSSNKISGVLCDPEGRFRLKVLITAVPESGKANKSLLTLLAKEFRIAKTSFEITQGATSSMKTLSIKIQDEKQISKLQEIIQHYLKENS